MADDLSLKIFDVIKEIQGSNDPEVFVKKLLRDTLNWPIEIDDLEEFDFDDLGYDWNSELETMGLRSDEGIQDLFQIAKFPGWPLGMFVVKFGSNSIFTKGRGMTTPLRNLLRNLVERVRPTANHQTWDQDQLLFMCHHEHQYFQFARFSKSEGDSLPKLQTFGWGPQDHIRTLCEHNLKFLHYNNNSTPIETLELIERAFDVSRVTSKFYQDYKQVFCGFKDSVVNFLQLPDDDNLHMHVQLIFNRIFFLRFIEKKGWLRFGENQNYLQNIFNSSTHNNSQFYDDIFTPLIHQGLTREGYQKSDLYGEVPLIGGGLFEQVELDKVVCDLPNRFFDELLGSDGLFYRYNFTVEESTPLDIQVAIDPEMLGTIFEELVVDRNQKGAFYTPKDVVSYMCKEGIKLILKEKTEISHKKINQLIDFDNVNDLLVNEGKEISKTISEIKAIDPACGSGAYLLGLLHELVKIRRNIDTIDETRESSIFDIKLEIITNSIFGVDRDEFATQIAMLRLWISLAIESEHPIYLPNLDFNIERGDSLLAPNPTQFTFDVSGAIESAKKLQEKKDLYVRSKGEQVFILRKEIRNEEQKIRDLLGNEETLERTVDFRVHFQHVFAQNGGFDFVLANPPYVSAIDHKKASIETRKRLAKQYSTASGTWDLYIPFIQRSCQLLRPNGVSVFINPNKYLAAPYGKSLREFILKGFNLIHLVDLSSYRVFQSASVYPVISIFRKTNAATEVSVFSSGENGDRRAYQIGNFDCNVIDYQMLKLSEDLLWGLLLSKDIAFLIANKNKFKSFEQFYKVRATSTASEADEYGSSLIDSKDGEGFKILNTGTIDPNQSLWGEKPLRHAGNVLSHPRLSSRVISENRNRQYTNKKILVAKLAKNCEPFFDENGEYGGLNINSVEENSDNYNLEFAFAYMLTDIYTLIYEILFGALKMQGGFLQFQAPQLRAMLIPETDSDFRKKVKEIVRSRDSIDHKEFIDKLNEIFTHLFIET